MSQTSRLQFDENHKLLENDNNKEILKKIKESKKDPLTRTEVLEKLKNYILLEDKSQTHSKLWVRYIKFDEGILRVGGFPIKNDPDEPFIVLKNVSKGFTFSIQKDNVHLFSRVPKDSLIMFSDEALEVLEKFENKNGTYYVAMDKSFKNIKQNKTIAGLARDIGVDRRSLGRVLRKGSFIFKEFILLKLDQNDIDILKEDIIDLQVSSGFNRKVAEIIDRYYA